MFIGHSRLIRLSALLLACLLVCAAVCAESVSVQPFRYQHDPRKNPTAMADIIEDPNAVYGFSPSPESKRLGNFAEYDWSDPDFVATARSNRIAYHAGLDTMYTLLDRLREAGYTIEQMARIISTERNRIRLNAASASAEELTKVMESNRATYGNEFGPTPDFMLEKYGDWKIVLQRAFSTNPGMDACCGLYDDCYSLYVELGMVEPDPETK